MRLAEVCGHPDPDALRQTIGPELIDKWLAYDEIEGIGLRKLIWTVARAGSLICLALGENYPPEKFVPGAEDDASSEWGQSDDEQMAVMEALAQR